MDEQEIREKMKLDQLEVPWHIQPCSAWTGTGLVQGFDWFSSAANGEVEISRRFNIKSAKQRVK